MLNAILEWDHFIFKFINNGLANPFFDFLLPFFREKIFWIPLYLLIAFFVVKKFEYQSVSVFILILFVLVLCDQLSSGVVKNFFQRLRPCNHPDFSDEVRLLVRCGSGYSFTSSHACNHFGLATIFIFVLKPLFKKGSWNFLFIPVVFYSWALTIAFSQVYVGVHFPLDVMFGAVLGYITALICIFIYKIVSKRLFPETTLL